MNTERNGRAEYHHHDHTHGMAKQTLRIAFFLTMIILAAGLIGGFLANSLALLSDAGHTITDLVALGLAWFAAVQAERPSNERKTFGYHRVGILAALINALSLIVIAFVITWEAFQRFQHPEPVQPLIMFGSAAIGVIVNLIIAFGLHKDEHNLNIRAASLHVIGDIGASICVIVAGGIIILTKWTIVDPLLSVGIALLIAGGAIRIMRDTIDILLEATPRGIVMDHLVSDMKGIEGVKNVHDLHVWSIASGMHALSSHVLIDNLPPSASASILQSLTAMLSEKYQISHSTIQFECNTHEGGNCDQHKLYCQLEVTKELCDHAHHRAESIDKKITIHTEGG